MLPQATNQKVRAHSSIEELSNQLKRATTSLDGWDKQPGNFNLYASRTRSQPLEPSAAPELASA